MLSTRLPEKTRKKLPTVLWKLIQQYIAYESLFCPHSGELLTKPVTMPFDSLVYNEDSARQIGEIRMKDRNYDFQGQLKDALKNGFKRIRIVDLFTQYIQQKDFNPKFNFNNPQSNLACKIIAELEYSEKSVNLSAEIRREILALTKRGKSEIDLEKFFMEYPFPAQKIAPFFEEYKFFVFLAIAAAIFVEGKCLEMLLSRLAPDWVPYAVAAAIGAASNRFLFYYHGADLLSYDTDIFPDGNTKTLFGCMTFAMFSNMVFQMHWLERVVDHILMLEPCPTPHPPDSFFRCRPGEILSANLIWSNFVNPIGLFAIYRMVDKNTLLRPLPKFSALTTLFLLGSLIDSGIYFNYLVNDDIFRSKFTYQASSVIFAVTALCQMPGMFLMSLYSAEECLDFIRCRAQDVRDEYGLTKSTCRVITDCVGKFSVAAMRAIFAYVISEKNPVMTVAAFIAGFNESMLPKIYRQQNAPVLFAPKIRASHKVDRSVSLCSRIGAVFSSQ